MAASVERKVGTYFLGTSILVGLDGAMSGHLSGRTFVGSTAAYLMLALAIPVAPDLAAAFALLVFLAVALARGPRVLDKLTGSGFGANAPRRGRAR